MRFAAFILLALLSKLCGANEVSCEGFRIISTELTAAEAEAYCRYAVEERKKVDAAWGPTWRDVIRIEVSSRYNISRALIPGFFGNRGFMEMPLDLVRKNRGALLHEIVHIYAPNRNRFLAEGLAVHLHVTLAGNRAYPNGDQPLSQMASRNLPEVDVLEGLDSLRLPQRLTAGLDERVAYVLAGSFVGFLVEKYGWPKFRELYESGAYERIYGKRLRVLELEWRQTLKEVVPAIDSEAQQSLKQ